MFRLAVEACPSGMLMVDSEGAIVLANAEIERQFGYARGELTGKPVDMLVPVRLRRQHATHRKAFSLQPQTRRVEARTDLLGLRKDGQRFPADVAPIQSEAMAGFVLGVVVDVRGAARSAVEGEFVAAVGQPLVSAASIAARSACSPAVRRTATPRQLLTIAYTNSRRLVRLFDDLLDIEDRTRRSSSFGVEVRSSSSSVMQVVTNLLSNAIKFSPPGESDRRGRDAR